MDDADDTQRLRELRQVVYREFVEEGRPPTAAEAARRLQLGVEEVMAGWGRLHDDHVLVLDDDRVGIRMAHPFSARPMHFVVASAEQKWWGGCAWDSFGIMAALDQRVLVATTCLGCGRPLALLADPDLRSEYAELKRAIVASGTVDSVAFSKAKHAYIVAVLERLGLGVAQGDVNHGGLP